MSQVSKKFLNPKVENRIKDLFLTTIQGLKDKSEILDFLTDFLSPTENTMLSKRLSIAFLIERGYTDRNISSVLKVSTSTIRSVDISYRGSKAYKKIINNIVADEEFVKSFYGLFEGVSGILAAGSSKSMAWGSIKKGLRLKRLEKPF